MLIKNFVCKTCVCEFDNRCCMQKLDLNRLNMLYGDVKTRKILKNPQKGTYDGTYEPCK